MMMFYTEICNIFWLIVNNSLGSESAEQLHIGPNANDNLLCLWS